MDDRYDNHAEAEAGFTLIELMVVVLILAILMAIAIPTFLGARSSAQDRAAQSNLTNAVTAAKTVYANNGGSFFGVQASDVAALQSAEPALSFVTGTPSAGTNQVEVAEYNANGVPPGQALEFTAVSATGTCWFILDIEQGASGATPGDFSAGGAGVYYAAATGSSGSGSTAAACGTPTTWKTGNGFNGVTP